MKKNSTLKIQIITSILLLGLSTQADPYKAAEGLDKIKSNVENSNANKGEYEKNLGTVNQNLTEISKAKETVAKQKEVVSSEIVKNNDQLKKVIMNEREITTLMAQEKEKLTAETKQLEQLEKLIQQIKQNQQKRETIISEYQSQLSMTQEEKKTWKGRETELRAQEGKTIQTLRGIAAEESAWKNKQKGYEIEVKRWSAEAEKQQKIRDTYQGLTEEK